MNRVLVTDGETRACLATVRSLGRAGHEVYVTATRLPAVAAVSRYTKAASLSPSPVTDPQGAVAALEALVGNWSVDVVVPVTDAAMRATLRGAGSEIGGAIVAGPTLAAYDTVSDKAALLELGRSVGLAVPQTLTVTAADQLEAAAAQVGYPCIIKPHRSVVWSGDKQHSLGVHRADGPHELDLDYPASAYPLLVQEYIIGSGEGVFLLMDRGSRVAAFAHRRLREKPPGGGVSVYREAMELQHDLVESSERLLRPVDWRGVAMVEFRRSAADGRTYLMEVNGRLWGSLQLAIDAGVDFPRLLVSIALGEETTRCESYRTGVRSRWFWGDVDHTLLRLRRSRATLGLPPDAPSRVKVLWEFLKFWRGTDRAEVWDSDDWRPFVRETLDWLRGRST